MNWVSTTTKKITLFLFFVFASLMLHAQANTLVMGTIKNAKVMKEIDLFVNQHYLTDETNVYSSKIIDDNTFAFAVEINEPQLVVLEYARNRGTFYLEPNDTLFIDCDAESFQYSFEFSGRSGHNNKLLAEYFKMNPPTTTVFDMTQYKQKNYWFQNSPQMDQEMMAMNRQQFTDYLHDRKDKVVHLLMDYETKYPQQLTHDFKEFLLADATYDRAYHLLLYGHVFKNKYDLSPDYFDFLEVVPLQNEQIGNQWYREFLLAYFDYLNLNSNKGETSYAYEYDLAADMLTGKALAFYRSEILVRAFRTKNQKAILAKYWEFTDTNEYGQFDEKVLAHYTKAMKFADGISAPEFLLDDMNNNTISLASFHGKTVYLNFWATWCRPCMKKMEGIKTIQRELENRGVIFLNISLDRSEEVWKRTVAEKSFQGVHVFAAGDLNSNIAKAYDVSVLPRYFIINKNGNFVKNPKLNSLEELKNTLIKTTNQ